MLPSLGIIVTVVCWGAFILAWSAGWLYGYLKGPKTARKSSPVGLSILGAAAIYLLYRLVQIFLPAGWAIPLPPWAQIAGGVLLVACTGLALWSRLVLGTMWSNLPETKVGHELRTQGPYRISRHPIYTGLIGMLLGSALLGGSIFWLAATVAITLMLLLKIRQEEKLMLETFGGEYERYRREVPQLLPGRQWLKPGGSREKQA